MNIHWDALLSVFVVALGSAVAVVALVALALRGLSPAAVADGPARRSRTETATAALCLTLAAVIVLAGLWVIVAK